jgi:hypothetical protein
MHKSHRSNWKHMLSLRQQLYETRPFEDLNFVEPALNLGYEQNRNLKALTKNLPRIRLLISVLGLRTFQIPVQSSVIGFTIFDIIG